MILNCDAQPNTVKGFCATYLAHPLIPSDFFDEMAGALQNHDRRGRAHQYLRRPSKLAISIMNGSNIEVIAAVNLPMLIKLASVRETSSLEQAVIQARDAGRKYIYVASRVLGAKPRSS
jgi:PTS system fructose IIA component